MQEFTYVGDPGRYYSGLGVTADPGDVVEFDVAPADGRWEDSAGQIVMPPEPVVEAVAPIVFETEHDAAPPAEGEPAATTEDTTPGGK